MGSWSVKTGRGSTWDIRFFWYAISYACLATAALQGAGADTMDIVWTVVLWDMLQCATGNFSEHDPWGHRWPASHRRANRGIIMGNFLLGGLRLQLTWSTLFKNYFFGAIMQGKCVPGVMLIGLRTLGIILILWFPGCRGSQR